MRRLVQQAVRRPVVVLDHAIGQVHRSPPLVVARNEQAAGRMEVDAVRSRRPELVRSMRAKLARRDAEGAAERPRERLRRPVPGVERQLDHRPVAAPQLVCRTLEQQTSPEAPRRLAQRSGDEPVEVEAAQVGPARQLDAGRRIVDARHENVDEVAEPVTRTDGSHEAMMRSTGLGRLIAFADLSLRRPSRRVTIMRACRFRSTSSPSWTQASA